ncbi:MAG: hypothetical protein HZC54_24590 [Verrucomicrobia bacterium]|nr:hypothetical protein [Verrucomicrobiota bacterium]
MKTLTVRLPESLVAQIEAESLLRKVPKSDVVRERLGQSPPRAKGKPAHVMELIGDLVGSVGGLPSDLSARKKHYLRAWDYGKNRPR